MFSQEKKLWKVIKKNVRYYGHYADIVEGA